jgi:hypothetical protein
MLDAAAHSPHRVDIEFLPKGLHDIGCAGMRERLQAAVDRMEPGRYDAVLLGYALCNNGIAGLRARDIPIVVARAHDCMTLFFGDRGRYMEYFCSAPGTYFLTSGWIERGEVDGELRQLSISHQTGMDMRLEDLVTKYGEDNARYLWDNLCDTTRNYSRITFISMGMEPDSGFEDTARARAEERGWDFDRVQGDMSLIRRLVNGDWDRKDFLVVPPGRAVSVSYDDGIIVAGEPGE